MKLGFIEGANGVTGSRHVIQVGEHAVLRDCGMVQGRRKEAEALNRNLGFDPGSLDAVVLSHAHIDHCGNLPSLTKAGYQGPIHATTATCDITKVMLKDAAHIQEQDAAYLNQKTSRKGLPEVEPLYTAADADVVNKLFVPHDYHQRIELAPGIVLEDYEAGHVLGSSLGRFELSSAGRTVTVGYAVDLGRRDLPLIRDPEWMTGLDVLVMESTYGNRLHDDAREAPEQLRSVCAATLERGGKVLIPSFALERAQELLFHISSLMIQGKLPKVPVYLDSPMAAEISRVFDRSHDYMDEGFVEVKGEMICLLCPPWIQISASVKQSKAVTASDEPCIVIAGSGMCEHGRIRHHLKHGIGNERNAIVLVGYQAAHTLGRRLEEHDPVVTIFGDEFTVKAEVTKLDAFSAHADRTDLLACVRASGAAKVYLVHGEQDSREALAEAIRAEGLAEVVLPSRGEWYDLV